MLMIPTQLKKSGIHGLGIFSGKDIKKDDLVWEENLNKVSIEFTEQEYSEIMKLEKLSRLFKTYSYKIGNLYWLDIDNGTFMNHSDSPNLSYFVDGDRKYYIANQDIKEGEELTCDYKEFDELYDEKIFPKNTYVKGMGKRRVG